MKLFHISKPSKLRCPAFGLTPCKTCPYAGEICKTCYAHYGMANMTNVAVNLAANWELAEDLLRCGNGRPWQLAAHLEASIPEDAEYFRWFWSGDCYRAELAEAIWLVAARRPRTMFWVTTRTPFFDGFDELPNLTVRKSTHDVNDFRVPFKRVSVATVAMPGVEIPAHVWECPGECGDCRVCWTHKDAIVAYRWHGSGAARKRLQKGMKQGWFSAPKGTEGEVVA